MPRLIGKIDAARHVDGMGSRHRSTLGRYFGQSVSVRQYFRADNGRNQTGLGAASSASPFASSFSREEWDGTT